MTIKRVRLNENVHEKLMELKRKSKARSINDVICSMIITCEEIYLNEGTLNVADKQVTLKYINGRLVEIKIE